MSFIPPKKNNLLNNTQNRNQGLQGIQEENSCELPDDDFDIK